MRRFLFRLHPHAREPSSDRSGLGARDQTRWFPVDRSARGRPREAVHAERLRLVPPISPHQGGACVPGDMTMRPAWPHSICWRSMVRTFALSRFMPAKPDLQSCLAKQRARGHLAFSLASTWKAIWALRCLSTPASSVWKGSCRSAEIPLINPARRQIESR